MLYPTYILLLIIIAVIFAQYFIARKIGNLFGAIIMAILLAFGVILISTLVAKTIWLVILAAGIGYVVAVFKNWSDKKKEINLTKMNVKDL